MAFAVRPRFDWRLRTRTLELGPRTLVMGVINVTPDSFSDGGQFLDSRAALTQAFKMLDEGADLLDLGGESTRPGSRPITEEEEQARVLPVLRAILTARPDAVISIDTYHAETARLAVEAGAEIVNDVSGHLWDAEMAAACGELGCGCVLTHTRGRPQEWRALPALTAEAVSYTHLDVYKRQAYLQHEVLGPRLRQCTDLVNQISARNIDEIFGYPDDLKFHSSVTLFAHCLLYTSRCV